jgi:hypothetical protein
MEPNAGGKFYPPPGAAAQGPCVCVYAPRLKKVRPRSAPLTHSPPPIPPHLPRRTFAAPPVQDPQQFAGPPPGYAAGPPPGYAAGPPPGYAAGPYPPPQQQAAYGGYPTAQNPPPGYAPGPPPGYYPPQQGATVVLTTGGMTAFGRMSSQVVCTHCHRKFGARLRAINPSRALDTP